MGASLFERYRMLVEQADELLGYSIRELCVEDPHGQLGQTRYTQPALYVVNALTYLAAQDDGGRRPEFAAGHSLGEFSALFAAGLFDFRTGLQLVKKRAELMSAARQGGMAAVIGLDAETVADVLRNSGLRNLDVANFNAPTQIVVSGDHDEIVRAQALFENTAGCRSYVRLPVSGAFHSRLMAQAGAAFADFLEPFSFSQPLFPVVANVTARPYTLASSKRLLAEQIARPVDWVNSIRYLWGQGVEEFRELGAGRTLTGLIARIQSEATPLSPRDAAPTAVQLPLAAVLHTATDPRRLGSAAFRDDYQLDYAYVCGGMVHGIASEEMIVRLGRAGMLGFFGCGGLGRERIEQAIVRIQSALPGGRPYGFNLLNGPNEADCIELFLKHGVRTVEASAYLQITPGLVRYRLSGLEQQQDGTIVARHRVLAKLSRPEIAALFLQPAPARIVDRLLEQGLISARQAQWSQRVAMADDLCVEADSGGHTDSGVAATLLPAIIRQRDAAMREFGYGKPIRVGTGGGIGTPEAAAAAFILGADFVVTGSINQCTVEAGTSALVKDILQEVAVQDTDYAPAGDMFEIGARVQVVKRGIFFPARANKLYDLYRNHNAIDEIDEKTQRLIQDKFFKRSFAEVYADCRRHHPAELIAEAERHPKKKMALIFRWYFGHSSRLALAGVSDSRVDFQIHCGPALGAFNQWVKDSPLESWKNRHVDAIGCKLMEATAAFLDQRIAALLANRTAQ